MRHHHSNINPLSFSAEYILPCRQSDPQLDTCIKGSFNHLRPYLAKGLPDIGVPPVEPLLIDRLVMENDAGPVRVTAAFSNITVIGPSNYTITKVRWVALLMKTNYYCKRTVSAKDP